MGGVEEGAVAAIRPFWSPPRPGTTHEAVFRQDKNHITGDQIMRVGILRTFGTRCRHYNLNNM